MHILRRDGEPVFVVLGIDEYERLVRAAGGEPPHLGDGEARGGELVPRPVVARLVAGEAPLAAWRKHRGLSPAELAAQAGLAEGAVADVERGARVPSVDELRAFAAALDVDVDDIA